MFHMCWALSDGSSKLIPIDAETSSCPVLGAMCQIQSVHSSPRRTPPAFAAVPGGWIDLTREGFYYAENLGILSFSVVAQSLVNQPYGIPSTARGSRTPGLVLQLYL